jgi:hypothetical protein
MENNTHPFFCTERKEKLEKRKSRSGSLTGDKDKKAKRKSVKAPPISQIPATNAAQTMSPTPTRTAPTEAAKKKDKTSKYLLAYTII